MGANGYRTAHYPHSEAMMEALDENGFIVMDETRWFESTAEGLDQLSMLVKRDRNRPSVFFWSIGNEEELHNKEAGRRITRAMVAHLKKLDTSRAILTAVTHQPRLSTVFDDTDVVSINYKWDHYDDLRQKYPHKPFLAAEHTAAGSTRGWYFPTDKAQGLRDAYDHDEAPPQFCSREYTQKFIAERNWVMGGYQWNAFEYMGESTEWPRLCSLSGAIDLYLQKKDAFYQNQSHWSTQPMVHLLPHWNFEGMEGHPIRVVAYTNAERVELFLNDKSVGVREIEKHGHGEWVIPYTAGKIEARAYNGDLLVATDLRETTGKAYRLKLSLDTTDVVPGDTAILSCYAVDRDGREIPDASPLVTLSAGGAGSLFTTGSSNRDHTTPFSSERRMWMGRVGLAVRLGKNHGTVTVYATANGLESAALTFDI
jgi:beta-galactosidase